MSAVSEGVVRLVDRPPFTSVGLVCKCGTAVAGMEGVVTRCRSCGTAYLVSVMVVSSPGGTGNTA